MRKKLLTMAVAGLMALSMAFTSFAGTWEQTGNDWKYKNDDGTYATGWQWIDGKSYYFGADGIMAKDTIIEGYTVNADGQWVVDGVVQTQQTQGSTTTTTAVQHSANYDPEHPLAHKIDELGLRLPYPYLETNYAGGYKNIQAMLTNQMDQFYRAPAEDPRWASLEAYNKDVQNTQILYEWFCNWLNGMDWENMTEMERAQEIKKVIGSASYDDENSAAAAHLDLGDLYIRVLIEKKGVCAEFAMTACALAKTLGLKSAISGTGNHAVYYLQVDGVAYMGSNEGIDLETPQDWVVFN